MTTMMRRLPGCATCLPRMPVLGTAGEGVALVLSGGGRVAWPTSVC